MSAAIKRRDVSPPAPSAPPPPNRLLLASVFGATLVVASVLLFVRVPTTTIELSGVLSGVGFVATQEQPLNRPLRVSAVGIAGVKDAQLPEEIPALGRGASAVRIATDSAGSIVVDRIVVPAGTQVWVSRTDLPRQYRISLRSTAAAPIKVHADVMGNVEFAPANARPTTVALRAPRPVDITGSDGTLDLDVTLAPGAAVPRWQQLVVRDVRVHRVEDEHDAARPLARPVSTVLSGSIFFESLGGTERKLRAGETLRFGAATGTILTFDLREDGIAATFQGVVREMRTSAWDHPRSLMPTLLDWLRRRQGLSLLWGTAIYIYGMGVALRRWWRKPE